MKKKYVLKKWVKVAIVILIFIIVLALDGLTSGQAEAIDNCMDQGHSEEYCKKGLFGY